jgi:hypothetical protein
MKHIKFTYVDLGTQLSVADAPAQTPVFPNIKGLQYLFALERKYPTMVPEFIGTCDDDADLTSGGFLKEMDAEEIAYERAEESNAQECRVRFERNARLNASDWTQVADAPVDQTAWATYRQALRDVTQQSGFPWTITWPTQPE